MVMMFGKEEDNSKRELKNILARQERQERRLAEIETRLNYLKRLVEVQKRTAG